MKKTSPRGFGVIFGIVLVAVLALAGGGLYMKVSLDSNKNTQTASSTTATTSTTSTTKSTAKDSVSTKSDISVSALAANSFSQNPGYVPNQVNITCNATGGADAEKILGFVVYTGDNKGALTVVGTVPTKTKSVVYVYDAPGTYTITCVPVVSGEDNLGLESPYAGRFSLKVGSAVAGVPVSTQEEITFSFSPTSGSLPMTATVSCDGPIKDRSGVTIFLDDMTKFSNFLYGVVDTAVSPEALVNEKIKIGVEYTKGEHKVYCNIQKRDGTSITSKPIVVNFTNGTTAVAPSPDITQADIIQAKQSFKLLTQATDDDTRALYVVKADVDEVSSFNSSGSQAVLLAIDAAPAIIEGKTIVITTDFVGSVFVREDGMWKLDLTATLDRY